MEIESELGNEGVSKEEELERADKDEDEELEDKEELGS